LSVFEALPRVNLPLLHVKLGLRRVRMDDPAIRCSLRACAICQKASKSIKLVEHSGRLWGKPVPPKADDRKLAFRNYFELSLARIDLRRAM
jgi:hypothetical protein